MVTVKVAAWLNDLDQYIKLLCCPYVDDGQYWNGYPSSRGQTM